MYIKLRGGVQKKFEFDSLDSYYSISYKNVSTFPNRIFKLTKGEKHLRKMMFYSISNSLWQNYN